MLFINSMSQKCITIHALKDRPTTWIILPSPSQTSGFFSPFTYSTLPHLHQTGDPHHDTRFYYYNFHKYFTAACSFLGSRGKSPWWAPTQKNHPFILTCNKAQDACRSPWHSFWTIPWSCGPSHGLCGSKLHAMTFLSSFLNLVSLKSINSLMEYITDWDKYKNPVNSAYLLAGCSNSIMPQPSRQPGSVWPKFHRCFPQFRGCTCDCWDEELRWWSKWICLVTAANWKYSRDFKSSLENITQVWIVWSDGMTGIVEKPEGKTDR